MVSVFFYAHLNGGRKVINEAVCVCVFLGVKGWQVAAPAGVNYDSNEATWCFNGRE